MEDAAPAQRVVIDGRAVLTSERPLRVLDQRGPRCVAVELGAGPVPDVVHLFSW